MKIRSLQLIGYKRFSLNDVNQFTLTTSASIQVILGTNGSGKSSLLEALSPYPQQGNDFKKGGSKVLEIEHNNSTYVLVSNYNSGSKHQFIKDGINLNEGGTATVQKQLVEKELGFNSYLHELLTGKVTFCEMSPVQRREWITKISNIDLNYAFKVYDNIKTRLRDAQGALKHYELRLAEESQRLISSVDLNNINKENDNLQEQISFYLTEKKSNLPNQVDIETEYKTLSTHIESLSLEIMKTHFTYKDKTKVKTLEEIIEIENTLISKEKSLYAVLDELQSQLKEDKETLRQLEEEGAINEKGLENKLSSLYEALSKTGNLDKEMDLGGNAMEARKDLSGVRMTLSELIAECSGESLKVVDKSLWESSANELRKLDSKVLELDNHLLSMCKKKEDIESARESKCPKCMYVWKPGISENELAEVKNKIDSLNKEKETTLIKLNQYKEICENIDTRKGEIQRFKAIAHSYPRLRNFWHFIAEKRFLYNDPKEIMYSYNLWLAELNKRVNTESLEHEIEQVESTLKRLKNVGEKADIDYFIKKEKLLSGKINSNYLLVEKNGLELKSIRKYKREYMTLVDKLSNLIKSLRRLKELEFQILEGKMQQEISLRLNSSQLNLSNNQRIKTEAETLTGIIDDLKSNIDKLTVDIQAMKSVEKALSPSDGLIAQVLSDFITQFVEQLNIFIKKVWDYDMKLVSCSLDNGELDYRFPLEIQGQSSLINDINKASAGQKEVINLAFVLSIMAHLELKDYPLFLDEMGSTFDDVHKSKSVNFIKWLVETNQCSQIWLVSHFAADHGGLTDSQICVLDANNISVPQVYNEHVSMS